VGNGDEGAYWLDTVYPAWVEAIDIERLNLQSTQACVLGQIAAPETETAYLTGYGLVRSFLKGDEGFNQEVHDWLAEQGFRVREEDWEYDEAEMNDRYWLLTAAWKEQIKERW
jgi:hypothetical protein